MAITANKSAPGEVTITLDDTFDFKCADAFRHAYESVDDGGKKDFVIDFRKTHYMDSSALGMLIHMEQSWKDRGSVIRIINTNPHLKRIFTISRFDKKFTID